MNGPNEEHTQPSRTEFSRAHVLLISVVSVGAVLIAGIGFAGSYRAVQQLAEDKGFGTFARLYPIGVDAGIVVLLAMSLLLSWMRIPFPLLRQAAWLLTGATVAFNAAAAWPDPLGTAMHAVIPVLFVVTVEAARHAIGRYAAITAGKHMDSVRASRWFLAPWRTFRLWRRMKLYELRDYDEVIQLEQERLVYQARLQSTYGRAWRREAPVEALLPLKLARFGVPLSADGASRVPLQEEPTAAHPVPPALVGPEPPDQQVHPAPGAAAGEQVLRPTDDNANPTPPAAPTQSPSEGADRTTSAAVPPPADGRVAVQLAYDALTDTDRATASARSLAQRLAPDLGLKESTVRIYINDLRKQHRRLVAVPAAPPDSDEPEAPEDPRSATASA